MVHKFKHIFPKTIQEWRDWLEENHDQNESIWLILPKKESGLDGLTLEEAVDNALCFGWIDSLPNKVDDKKYKLRMSPRGPKSNWSRVNKQKIARLEKAGLIAEPGYEMVRIAKENGTWNALDDVENLIVPSDLQEELSKYRNAAANFEAFPRSVKRGILEWIFNAKRDTTRQKRIQETAKLAEKNIRANQYRN